MVCYSDKMKFQCSRVVLGVSALTVVMGLLCVVFGVIAGNKIDVSDNEELSEAFGEVNTQSSFANIVLAGGVLCIITGIVGLATAKFKSPFCAAPFIGLSFIIGLLLFIGAIMAGSNSGADIIRDNMCAKVQEKAGMSFKEAYGSTVDKIMCTPICPCDVKLNAKWKDLNDTYLDSFGRRGYTTNPAQTTEDGNVPDMAEGKMFLFFTEKTDETQVYSKWIDCYDERLSKADGGGNTDAKNMKEDAEWSKNAQAFLDSGAKAFLTDMEDKYQCGSMCTKPLFPAMTSIEKGPAERDCVDAMVYAASGETGAAVVAGLSALILFIGGFGAFPLCSDFSGKSKSSE